MVQDRRASVCVGCNEAVTRAFQLCACLRHKKLLSAHRVRPSSLEAGLETAFPAWAVGPRLLSATHFLLWLLLCPPVFTVFLVCPERLFSSVFRARPGFPELQPTRRDSGGRTRPG